MPIGYGWIILDTVYVHVLPLEVASHLFYNALCNSACFLYSFYRAGRGAQKLYDVARFAICVHLCFLLIISFSRLYYSRPVLLLGFISSIGLALLAHVIYRRLNPPMVALVNVSVTPELLGWLGGQVELVDRDDRDLRHYDTIIFGFAEDMPAKWVDSISKAMLAGVEVQHVARYLETSRGRVSIDHFNLDQLSHDAARRLYMHVKRMLDISLVVLFSPIIAVALGLAAVAVYCSMGKPVFFVQDRIGLAGRPFKMYKLRSMRTAAGHLSDEERITPVGRILRRFAIDELPQMWNVLLGQMSLIGPRPEQPDRAAAYAQRMPGYEFRHIVRPGITGWAQVQFGYAVDYIQTREKVTYDLYYVKYMSLLLDLQIALLTVRFILGPRAKKSTSGA